MKKIVFAWLLTASFIMAGAQEKDPETLHETARTFMRKGDYDNALLALNRAIELKPDDAAITRDIAYVSYLHRDFSKAIEVSTRLIERDEADVQSFQVLGLTYKAIAEYDNADKLYKKGLKKFPSSGVLHADFGELLLAQKKQSHAITEWEKGIETEPGYGTNYYFASRYYYENNRWLWAVLYGEVFVNIESLSARTAETKELLFAGYKKLLETNATLTSATKKEDLFGNAVVNTLNKYYSLVNGGITPESLNALRTKFITDWYTKTAADFPSRLFEYQNQLLKEGTFEAYNQWLFATPGNNAAYQAWLGAHDKEAKALQAFQRSIIFKVPAGQYYIH